MNYRLILCAICLLFICSFNLKLHAQISNEEKVDTVFSSPFRYVIVNNQIDPKLNKRDLNRRFVEVLMDKKSFSKENLIILFNLVTKRYPNPHLLYIKLFTDLTDIETPEEREQSRFSDVDETKERVGDLAVFIRNGKKSFFYIYAANGDFDEVEIK
jgi:hypothetical protein